MLPELSDSPGTPRWQVQGICRRYGRRQVLRDISFYVRQGQILGLLGPNGSGKSTLLEVLALAAKPDAGRILLDGCDILPQPGPVRPLIGYVPQDIALFEELTVEDNLRCWCRLKGAEARSRMAEVTTALSLGPLARQKVAALSGGMKRRVNLGVALLGYPTLLVLDEPFSGVDIDHREAMQLFLRQLAGLGVSQVISGHSLDEILPLADRVLVLREGRSAYCEDIATFRSQMTCDGLPSPAFKNLLLGAAPAVSESQSS